MATIKTVRTAAAVLLALGTLKYLAIVIDVGFDLSQAPHFFLLAIGTWVLLAPQTELNQHQQLDGWVAGALVPVFLGAALLLAQLPSRCRSPDRSHGVCQRDRPCGRGGG